MTHTHSLDSKTLHGSTSTQNTRYVLSTFFFRTRTTHHRTNPRKPNPDGSETKKYTTNLPKKRRTFVFVTSPKSRRYMECLWTTPFLGDPGLTEVQDTIPIPHFAFSLFLSRCSIQDRLQAQRYMEYRWAKLSLGGPGLTEAQDTYTHTAL